MKMPSSLPPELVIAGARKAIWNRNKSVGKKLVVLDDDPTGCQTVHGIRILTSWEPATLQNAWRESDCFYVLSNSRAYPANEAMRLNKEVVSRILSFANKSTFQIISRSDSTLRGHFLEEISILSSLAGPFDGILVAPYFKEGGRLTLESTHYVQQGNDLIRADQTEFAKDPVFGFSTAFLPGWIEEKSNGDWKKEDVVRITISDIRDGGVEAVCHKLCGVKDGRFVVVDSLTDADLEVVVLGLIKAEQEGKRFLYRTASSFVKVRAGLEDQPLWKPPHRHCRGFIIVGSYVQKSTEQLNYLLRHASISPVTVNISQVLGNDSGHYLQKMLGQIEDFFRQNKSVVIYTERQYVFGGTGEDRLEQGRQVISFLCEIVKNLQTAPAFIIAKGGITSHEVAKTGLSVSEALVLGQVLPGIPVWKLGEGSRYPDLPYIVFPGNVGDERALEKVYSGFIKNKA